MESEFEITIFGLKMIVKSVESFLIIHFPKTGVWSTWWTSDMPNGKKFTHKGAFNNYVDKNRGRGVNRMYTVGHVTKDRLRNSRRAENKRRAWFIGKNNKRRAWKIWQKPKV